MALINIDDALRRAVSTLKKAQPPAGLELLTYKRNRGVAVTKLEDGTYQVHERGYREEVSVVSERELSRLLKTILKRECPRSRKVRLYHLASAQEAGRPRKTL